MASPRQLAGAALAPVILLLLAFSPGGWDSVAGGASTPAVFAASAASSQLPPPSVTAHTITAGGRTLAYTATAGALPLRDKQGRVEASMFFVAYTARGVPDASARPVTFAFNGGPGASSVLLNLGALGPKRAAFGADGEVASAAPLVDNDQTWLPFTDLVLVDAIGTGYSAAAPGVPAGRFYQVRRDAEAFAQFIHLYLTAYHRDRSPVFLAGESYGGTRAAILSDLLPRHYGVSPRGLILISPVLDFTTLNAEFDDARDSTDLAFAVDVPSYAATAWYHRRLAPELLGNLEGLLRRVERWAVGTYLPALVEGDALPAAEQHRIAGTLSEYTGVPEAFVLAHHLRLLPGVFRHELLRPQGLVVGANDGRVAFAPAEAREHGTGTLTSALGAAFTRYLQAGLRFATDRPYVALSGAVVRTWNWDGDGLTGPLKVTGDLRRAMRRNPEMRVLVAQGYYDLTVPYYGTTYALNHLALDPARAANMRQRIYRSGHMVYTAPAALEELTSDARALITAGAPTPAHP